MAERREAPAGLVAFEIDLSAHEMTRRQHVLAATPDWDPGEMLARESEAWALLTSDLDDEQLAVYRMLIDAGVLDA